MINDLISLIIMLALAFIMIMAIYYIYARVKAFIYMLVIICSELLSLSTSYLLFGKADYTRENLLLFLGAVGFLFAVIFVNAGVYYLINLAAGSGAYGYEHNLQSIWALDIVGGIIPIMIIIGVVGQVRADVSIWLIVLSVLKGLGIWAVILPIEHLLVKFTSSLDGDCVAAGWHALITYWSDGSTTTDYYRN